MQLEHACFPSTSQETNPVPVRELPLQPQSPTTELSPNSDILVNETPSTSLNRNNLALPTVAKVYNRYGLSTRSAAAVALAVLAEEGLVSSKDLSPVIDKNKIHRAVSNARTKARKDIDAIVEKAIYFDGRKDKTLINDKIGDRYHHIEVLQKHISVLTESGSIYLGHTTPSRNTAKGITDSIISLLESQVTGNVPELSDNIMKELSTDQKYLYEMCHAVTTGSCSLELASCQSGKMAHSRWLITANRILRFYIMLGTPKKGKSEQLQGPVEAPK
ncbi:unnamed protein product [Diatraea saccharalis]|uniref:Uncharacterized protein n=1 Tax=Diatraea saccharalis TaxID=40085 RepID=A0A9N9R881_9NEOP|nr:unnamed protein product [Diatraea saccharalis]